SCVQPHSLNSRGFNPCCPGSPSGTTAAGPGRLPGRAPVSILVVLDLPLGRHFPPNSFLSLHLSPHLVNLFQHLRTLESALPPFSRRYRRKPPATQLLSGTFSPASSLSGCRYFGSSSRGSGPSSVSPRGTRLSGSPAAPPPPPPAPPRSPPPRAP